MSFSIRRAISALAALPNRPLLFALLVGFGLSIFMIGRLIYSDFSILDDHMIIGWLGHDLHARIASTELAQFGTGPRFRPTMYLTVILESMAFGDHAFFYRPLQIVMFGVLLSAIAWAAFRTVGVVVGLVLLFLVINGRYWGNIWTHSLFPSEQFASFGLGLIVFGFGAICSWYVNGRKEKLDRPLLLVTIGATLCVGAKENFLPLIPLSILTLVVLWRCRTIANGTVAACLVMIAMQLAICYAIIVPNIGRPTDMYGTDTNLLHHFALITHSKRFALREFLALGGGVTAGLWARWRNAGRPARETRELVVLSLLLLWSGVYACWEQFFYSGRLPVNYRYDFPALLIDPILAGAAFYVAMRIADNVAPLRRQFSPLALRVCAVLLILPLAVSAREHGELLTLRRAIRISNEHTAAMAADLGHMRALTQLHPDWPVVVRVAHPLDYEAVVTFPGWLKHFRVSNPAVLQIDLPPEKITSPLEASLVSTMRGFSEQGSPAGYQPRSKTVQAEEAQGHCYIVAFGPEPSPCMWLGYHPENYFPVEQL